MVQEKSDSYVYYTEMKNLTLTLLFLLNAIVAFAQNEALGTHNIIIDGSLSDAEAAKSPYIFNDFTEASRHFVDGTADSPMRVSIKPWVYWIDNPNDTTVMVGKNGAAPIGLYVKCQHLQLVGLGEKPEDVVLASRRGQTQGAIGNYTMLDFTGDNLVVKNLTMGNFLNVDLVYPLRPELGMKKKSNTITQAHVANCHGDNIYAENVRFISRLNMTPLGGARRILFKDCHMEMTDDALCSTGVYLHCDFDFYGSQPAWNTDTYGAVFIDCDFNVKHGSAQFFCKSQNPVTAINCRYHSPDGNSDAGKGLVGWTKLPSDWLRCYQYNNVYDGSPIEIGKFQSFGNVVSKPYNTVTLSEKLVRERFTVENLLSDKGKLATGIRIQPRVRDLQTGNESATFTAELYRHCGQKAESEQIKWRVQPGFEQFVKIEQDGAKASFIPTNNTDITRHFYVEAYTESGLVGATELTVKPSTLPAPLFTKRPKVKVHDNVATLDYELDLQGREDQSLITWYRCVDKKGTKDIPVAVSRMNKPETNYSVTPDDFGYYIKAVVRPKHLRSEAGNAMETYTQKVTATEKWRKKGMVTWQRNSEVRELSTDFHNFPTSNQPEIIPGFWTLDGYKPADTYKQQWGVDMTKDFWAYDKGFNGAVGYGIVQAQKGARMLYTPRFEDCGDMEVTWQVDPTKLAGQGFGSATDQYMDVYINFDTRTLTGYALRIERTIKYGNAVDFTLMKYENGKVTPISETVSSTCYRTGCRIMLNTKHLTLNRVSEGDEANGNMILTADVTTTTSQPASTLAKEVHLKATVPSNSFGGFGLQHTGSCGESTTMIHGVQVRFL